MVPYGTRLVHPFGVMRGDPITLLPRAKYMLYPYYALFTVTVSGPSPWVADSFE
ncbi:MAG: hypothetical protein Q9214_004124 [Letrouitia sp. 1 TL-2023]